MNHFYGDLVVMLIDVNNTPNWIHDDRIVNAYFCKKDEAGEIIRTWKNKHKNDSPSLTVCHPADSGSSVSSFRNRTIRSRNRRML